MTRLGERLTCPSRARPAGASGSRAAPRLVRLRLLTATVARMILTTSVSLSLWAAAPALLGWHPTTVVTGSMQPRINPGDVVSARPIPAANLKLGMVLLVDDPDHPDRLRLHRLVRFSDDGQLILRGDANPQEDSSHVDRKAVHGVGALRVPYVASPLLWLHEDAWIKLAGLVGVILSLVAALGLGRDLTPAVVPDPEPSDPGADPT